MQKNANHRHPGPEPVEIKVDGREGIRISVRYSIDRKSRPASSGRNEKARGFP